jgi:hypothetical protein
MIDKKSSTQPEARSKAPPECETEIEPVFDRLADHGLRPRWLRAQEQIVAFCPLRCDRKMSLLVEETSDGLEVKCTNECCVEDIYAGLDLRNRKSLGNDVRIDSPHTRELLESICSFVRRFVVLPDAASEVATALFVLHTWAIDAAFATPYLLVVSPEKGAGKSRLLEVLGLLVRRPWRTASTTEAALFRKIEQDSPTLLLDEIDAVFASNTDRTEPLRAVLNAGNRRGGSATRVVGQGTTMAVRDFGVFCPKVLAGIDTGRLPDTIRDRAIVLHMKRRHGGERVERWRERFMDGEAQPLVSALEGWATAATNALEVSDPVLPEVLSDRAADAWEPLLAIADHAGGEWSAKARAAAIELSGTSDGDETSSGTLLLGAARRVMAGREVIATADLLTAINADEELPFGGWRESKGLDARTLARMLKRYDDNIRPRTVRIGDDTAKGYHAEDFADAWTRYLSPPEASHASQPSPTDQRSDEKPHEQRDVTDVTDVTGAAEVADDQLT